MEKRDLGDSGLQTPPLIFGGNVFGWTLDEKASFDILDAWLDAGFTMVDTADVYSRWADGHSGGESETVLGRYFKERGNREKVLLATKVGMDMGGPKRGLSKSYILKEVEESLRRLQTDYIDLYFSHTDDTDAPLEDTLEAYDKLIDQGKVRAIGASNYSADRLREAQAVARDNSLPHYSVLQPKYNLYDRADFESGLKDVCAREGLGVTPYFALASGFLTGKYKSAEDARGKAREQFVSHYFDNRGQRILEALDTVAERFSTSIASVSLAWLMAQPTVTAPIASATSRHQLAQMTAAAHLKLDGEALALLDQASQPD